MRCRGELTETGARLPGQLESEGRAAPVCILFNNNSSFTLPWSTAWTLRPESRCNFQLLWDLDYASGQREPSGGGNRTAGAKGTARAETEPTRGRTKEQTGVGARYSGHKCAAYPRHGRTPWPATLTGGFEPRELAPWVASRPP